MDYRWATAAAALLMAASGCEAPSSEPAPAHTSANPGASTSSVPPTPSTDAPSAPLQTPVAPADVVGMSVAGTIDGFDRPWDLRFLPDGTPLVTERPGRLVTVIDGQRAVVAEVPGVVARGEGGLMGMAIDPDFASTRFIYTCMAAGSAGRVRDVRVVRFTLSTGLDSLADARPLVTGIPAGAGNRHLGCRLEIGPDGMLWITTGDAVRPTAPQDPRSRAGKVLRATLAGEPAPGNPGGQWDPYVYTMGHRNVQGLAFRPEDGAAVGVEHGTSCDDEINVLTAGANYGWDPEGRGGRYDENAPMTAPGIAGAVPAAWSSGCPTIAPSGAEFIAGRSWGSWTGRLAVAVLKGQHVLLATMDGDQVTDVSTALDGDLGRLRTVRNAPDGSLWLSEDASPGALVRIVPELD